MAPKKGVPHSGQFKKGFDPKRTHQIQLGEVLWKFHDSPKVTAKTVDTIPAEFHVVVSPDETGLELVDRLRTVIDFAREMHAYLSETICPQNMMVVGRYTELINSCIDTEAKIRGRHIKPADYGNLDDEGAQYLREVFASNLSKNLTKMAHGVDYARRQGVVAQKTGEAKKWATDGFASLISGSRNTIERRARLDAWEAGGPGRQDDLIGAYQRVVGNG